MGDGDVYLLYMEFTLSIKTVFAGLSIGITAVGGFWPYFRDIFRRKTTPHAYTWLIWSLTQGTALVGLWYGDGGWAVIPMLAGTILVFLTFLLSLRFGSKSITRFDTIILIAALGAIIVWWQLHNPWLSVLMVTMIDVIGYVPSFRKTYREPWSETVVSWLIFAVTNLFSIAALSSYNFYTLTYLVAITVANVVLLAISILRRRTIPYPNYDRVTPKYS